MTLQEIQALLDAGGHEHLAAHYPEAIDKMLAVVRAAKTLRDNYGGEARDGDLAQLDAAFAALEVRA